MGKRGPPPKLPHLKALSGTDQPCRRTERIVSPVEDAITCPKWLKGKARRFFLARAKVYEQRGIEVAGCEEMLAHYCCLHVKLAEQWASGQIPSKGLLDTLKSYAVQFYDVPTAQFDKPAEEAKNPFAKHGSRLR